MWAGTPKYTKNCILRKLLFTYAVCRYILGLLHLRIIHLSYPKKTIRAIYGLSQRTSCAHYFKDILTLPCIFIYECAKFVKNNPECFRTNSNFHNYPTRSASYIYIPQHSLKLCDNNPSYIAPLIYNALPENIKNLNNFTAFKLKLFDFLVKATFYDVQQFFSHSR